jgi:hypothetical protein
MSDGFWRDQWGGESGQPKPHRKKMRFVVADSAPIPLDRWPNLKDGLILLATQFQESFFRSQRTELRPMLILVSEIKGTPHFKIMVPDRSLDGFQEAFMDIISTNAKVPGFQGALVITEGYMTMVEGLPPGEKLDLETLKKKGRRRESLIIAVYNKKGLLQMRTTPFHRAQIPGLPVADGPTRVMDEGEDYTSMEGRLVPDL